MTGEVSFPEWTDLLRRLVEAAERQAKATERLAAILKERLPGDLGMEAD